MPGRIRRRIVSFWFPRLASDRALRQRNVAGPFALTARERNTNRIHCLNELAERQGLHRGMPYADARAFCPELQSRLATPEADDRFLLVLRRWATRYCPWVGLEGTDGLVLDVTGSAHLFGGEAAMLADMRQRLMRGGFGVRIGVADTRGGAWALARHGEGVAAPGEMLPALQDLPVAALRLDEEMSVALRRLGLHRVGDLAAAARGPLSRRFGPGLLLRLDQALGDQPEEITPLTDPPRFGVVMNLPEPIGQVADVMAGTARLLEQLCSKLEMQEVGARQLVLSLRRVDHDTRQVELTLARPLRDPMRILPLFERGVSATEAGFGIDQLRLQAIRVEAQPVRQISHVTTGGHDRVDDLITRIGARIGLENVQRVLPADSHIPERSFLIAAAAWSEPEQGEWNGDRPRPVRLFPPEPVSGQGKRPPGMFRWRNMEMTTRLADGPERITPEWWFDDPDWRSGVRDYWRVETAQGARLWMFHTLQDQGWFVQGEFA